MRSIKALKGFCRFLLKFMAHQQFPIETIFCSFLAILDKIIPVSDTPLPATFFIFPSPFCKTGMPQIWFCVKLSVNFLKKFCFFKKKSVTLHTFCNASCVLFRLAFDDAQQIDTQSHWRWKKKIIYSLYRWLTTLIDASTRWAISTCLVWVGLASVGAG